MVSHAPVNRAQREDAKRPASSRKAVDHPEPKLVPTSRINPPILYTLKLRRSAYSHGSRLSGGTRNAVHCCKAHSPEKRAYFGKYREGCAGWRAPSLMHRGWVLGNRIIVSG